MDTLQCHDTRFRVIICDLNNAYFVGDDVYEYMWPEALRFHVAHPSVCTWCLCGGITDRLAVDKYQRVL